MVKAEKYMNFFGLGLEPFSASILDYSEKNSFDDDLIAWFGHGHFAIYDGAAQQQIRPAASYTSADRSTAKYWFRNGGSPNDSILHILMPTAMLPYDANNPYGGLFTLVAPTTQGYASVFKCDEAEDTELICASTLGAGYISYFYMYDALYRQTNTLNLSITGTYLADDNDMALNLKMIQEDCKYYNGITNSMMNNNLVYWMIDNANFSGVDKKEARK